jgi:hypothetical protein
MGNQDKQKRKDIFAGRAATTDNQQEQAEAGKGLGRTDMNYGKIQGVEGRTIGGAGSTGTGDPSGDFDRPGTEGLPAVNDYVETNWPNIDTTNKAEGEGAEERNTEEDDNVDVPDDIERADPRSGYPLGGAARGPEDKL